jgi:hypothetical protein
VPNRLRRSANSIQRFFRLFFREIPPGYGDEFWISLNKAAFAIQGTYMSSMSPINGTRFHEAATPNRASARAPFHVQGSLDMNMPYAIQIHSKSGSHQEQMNMPYTIQIHSKSRSHKVPAGPQSISAGVRIDDARGARLFQAVRRCPMAAECFA